jgi:hypothetical protein
MLTRRRAAFRSPAPEHCFAMPRCVGWTTIEGTMPRELIEPHKGDKRYVRRGKTGQFTKSQVDVGRSLSADRRSKSKTVAKKGEGDRGDRRARG